jgi:DNA polymerase-1
MKKKLFLLDAMALIYRAHFAFSKTPRINSKGMNTGATLGFTNTLLEVLNKEKPTHIAVAFDRQGPTFRHESFEAYKAHRQEQPEDITLAIPICKQILKGFGIPVLEMQGFEADDIVGTLAKKASAQGYQVFMMTSDKDYCQLVNESVFVYRPAFMGNGPEVFDIPKVLAKFNINKVEQVIDILGLMGDSVDNIPGIPGIGEKTAQKLVAEYGSVENLIANADQLTGKLKENVVKFAEQGLMSKKLATIHTDVPIAFEEASFAYTGPEKEIILPIFEELEFKTLSAKLFSTNTENNKTTAKSTSNAGAQIGLFDAPPAAKKESDSTNVELDELFETPNYLPRKKYNIHNNPHDYYIADSQAKIRDLVKYLQLQEEFCFDTETTSTDALQAELVGMSFCYYQSEAYYVPFPENREKAIALLEVFKPVFQDVNIMKIGQNLKYDLHVLANYGLEVKGALFDTMLAHYLIEPDMRHGMDILADSYLDYIPVSIEELIGKKGDNQGNMRQVELSKIAEYAAEDADVTFRLKKCFVPIVKKNNLEKLFFEVETPLIQVLADVERAGVKVDVDALAELSESLSADIQLTENEVYELAGQKFNVSSPKQLGTILFEKMKIDLKAKKTATGQYATGEEVLSKLAFGNPIVDKILEYRELCKLKSTYVDALPTLISSADGRIHTSFNQAVAATGRLSSTNPNLQNIPIRTEKGREIRKAFIPQDNDYVILSADYSQIELRIMAAFCEDETMMEAFRNGMDIHASTASKIFKVPLEQVTSDMRRKAKTANFGIIYGISSFGLSQRLNIPKKEAAEIIESYFAQFPAVKKYMDTVINQAKNNGFVETILHRKRFLRDINSANFTQRGMAERNAINAPIQGSAADIIKIAMVNIHRWMKEEKLKSKMVLQVHDELVFEAHKNELDILKTKVEHFMKNAHPLSVPMEVGIGVGRNWLEAH